VATRFSEFTVAAFDYLFDFFNPHFPDLQTRDISKIICIFVILADLKMKSINESGVIEF